MCDYLSGFIHTSTCKIATGDMVHHDESRELLGIVGDERWREWEWTERDSGASLVIRTMPTDKHDEPYYRACILGDFPKRDDCEQYLVDNLPDGVEPLDLPAHLKEKT